MTEGIRFNIMGDMMSIKLSNLYFLTSMMLSMLDLNLLRTSRLTSNSDRNKPKGPKKNGMTNRISGGSQIPSSSQFRTGRASPMTDKPGL